MILISNKHILPTYSDLRSISKNSEFKFQSYSYKIPTLPDKYDKDFEYKGIVTNPFKVTCTCGDYFSRAAVYPERDIRRICVHLFYKLCKKKKHVPGYDAIVDLLTVLLLTDQFKYGVQHLFRISVKEAPVLIGYSGDPTWLNVYKQSNEIGWFRYSYCISLKRWSENIFPLESEEIANRIHLNFETVFITVKGKKYHCSNCWIVKNTGKVLLGEALINQLTPCSFCIPDVKRSRCNAFTKRGKVCKHFALSNKRYCWQHVAVERKIKF